MAEKLVLGTRGSDLARTQTQMVVNHLRRYQPDLPIEVRIIKTSGDETSGTRAALDARAGRKGLFTAEIERVLLAGQVAAAVHSAKDLPGELAADTEVVAVLPRGPIDDVLVAPVADSLESLPAGAMVATGSIRRKHQLLWKRPDLKIFDLRGNVPTRLRKLAESGWDGIVLARAGLERLGLLVNGNVIHYEGIDFKTARLPGDCFVPAGGQGIVAVQIRAADDQARRWFEPINALDTALCLLAERTFLRLLQADCNQPVGVLATANGSLLQMRAQIFDSGTPVPKEGTVEGAANDVEGIAQRLFQQIHGQ
jgi:hydroxymethylbilane synthase